MGARLGVTVGVGVVGGGGGCGGGGGGGGVPSWVAVVVVSATKHRLDDKSTL